MDLATYTKKCRHSLHFGRGIVGHRVEPAIPSAGGLQRVGEPSKYFRDRNFMTG